jgi:hypothetical protein
MSNGPCKKTMIYPKLRLMIFLGRAKTSQWWIEKCIYDYRKFAFRFNCFFLCVVMCIIIKKIFIILTNQVFKLLKKKTSLNSSWIFTNEPNTIIDIWNFKERSLNRKHFWSPQVSPFQILITLEHTGI